MRGQYHPAMCHVRCDLRIERTSSFQVLFLGHAHTPAGGKYGCIKDTISALTNMQIVYSKVQISSPIYHLVST